MKKIFTTLLFSAISVMAFSQDFAKNLTEAKSAYSSKKLSDSRFAMEQMLKELDLAIAKDILKLLPVKMDALNANTKADNVSGSSGSGVGLYVQRTYGTNPKTATVEVINNSPLITTLNAFLSMPLIGSMASDPNQKTVKVQGYKSVLTKTTDTDTNKTNYELQVPMNNTLFTLKMDDATEADILRLAGTVPLPKIAEMAQ
ncbi:hypothetical protein GXP67_19780 [Rhodocytophaga rosea]|uniref:DUF4251 domain-containing protein n=1 Tax=Rhodocytophaga rosea TaxID=2704465 RepID=A0A6C0GLN3_9BACT|nr:hypothetical protein [Rhodocytophaga rosea]QHT68724.1 hypothetical protein GXP67_19780 [Rhodocytophaga rosea]